MAAFRATFPDGEIPIPTSHLRAQSQVLLRSRTEQHVAAGYFLHGVAKAMDARRG
jgi:hypothetical protein